MAAIVAVGRKRASPVWNYFTYGIVNDKSVCKAKNGESICGRQINGNNATNVRAHLRATHKKEYDELLKNESKIDKQSKAAGQLACRSAETVPIMSAFNRCKPWPDKCRDATIRNEALTDMIVMTGIPMSIIANPSFKEFCLKLDPRFKVPGTRTVNSCMQSRMNDGVEAIKAALAEARKVSLGMDIWTKKGYDQSYLGITACFYHATSK